MSKDKVRREARKPKKSKTPAKAPVRNATPVPLIKPIKPAAEK
jgi:hypothetical protein